MTNTYTAYHETKQEAKDYIYCIENDDTNIGFGKFTIIDYGYKDGKYYTVVRSE